MFTLFLWIVILLARAVDALSHALVDGLVLALGVFVLTFPLTTAVGYVVKCMLSVYPRLDKMASLLLLTVDFSPNWYAFSRVVGSLFEDLGSITLVNDANHSMVWLYFWFTFFPVAEAVLEELAECCDLQAYKIQLDDLALGVTMEALQAVLFLYFADYSPEAKAFFGLMFLYQTAMVIGKVFTKDPTPITGKTTGDKIRAFVKKYQVPLGAMFAFALVQFSIALVGVELSDEVQAAFAAIPWAIGLAMELELPEITDLSLENESIDDKKLTHLMKELDDSENLGRLTRWNLSSNQIGDAGMIEFSRRNDRFFQLSRLELNNNQIGDNGMVAFTQALEPTHDPSMGKFGRSFIRKGYMELHTLDLGGNNIADDGLAMLFPFFKTKLSNLAFFSIGSGITDVGMRALSDEIAIGSLRNLQDLRLNNNQISDAGMIAFANAIGSLSKLQQLWLNSNKIGDEGMKAFSTAISSGGMGPLEKLYLHYNKIGDTGMISLSEAIGKGLLPACKEIWVMSNPGNQVLLKAACKERGIKCGRE